MFEPGNFRQINIVTFYQNPGSVVEGIPSSNGMCMVCVNFNGVASIVRKYIVKAFDKHSLRIHGYPF